MDDSPIQQLIAALQADASLAARVTTPQDTVSVAAELGIEITDTQAQQLMDALTGNEIAEEHLDQVAGGATCIARAV